MDKFESIRYKLLPEAYNPAGPVTKLDMFKGRSQELESVLDCLAEPGRSVIVFGERGVGKTSLATVVFDLTHKISQRVPYWYALTTCNRTSTFRSLWSEAFRSVQVSIQKPGHAGFDVVEAHTEKELSSTTTLAELLGETAFDPSSVRSAIETQASVWIFDEFNLLERGQKEIFSDLMKALSDRNSMATVVLVCVADDVRDVISAHESVERCTKQIQMPRMDDEELEEILRRGEEVTEMQFSATAARAIVRLSQGLPYFTHFLARQGSTKALGAKRLRISRGDVIAAIEDFVSGAQESLKESYRRAVHSKSPQAIHAEVLLACATARRDSFGNFTITAVSEAMTKLRGKRTTPGVFASHMAKFSTDLERGVPLTRKGAKGNYVYRFSNPLLQPYVILRGISEGRLGYESLTG